MSDGQFETWYDLRFTETGPNHVSLREHMRDAYAAGMQDPTAAQGEKRNVHALHQGEVSRRTAVAVEALDNAIREAVNAAKDANVPQGLVVALLHAHAQRQTAELLWA